MSHKNYDEMINLSYPFPFARKRMSQSNRAAQFAPFAALTGYDDQVKESSRFTDTKLLLGEDQILHINAKLIEIANQIKNQPEIEVTYFEPDTKKQGGHYSTLTAHIKRIDDVANKIIFIDNFSIPINNILDILIIN